MPIFEPSERAFAEAMSALAYCNPFLPERLEWERKALGPRFVEAPRSFGRQLIWELDHVNPNVAALSKKIATLVGKLRQRLAQGVDAAEPDLVLYQDLALSRLYRRHLPEINRLINGAQSTSTASQTITVWDSFLEGFNDLLKLPGRRFPNDHHPAMVFASFFQMRRAYYNICHNIFGTSLPAAKLRGDVWWSVFTHDMRRYFRCLYGSMSDVATLITGPSGTGKELVAKAIGGSQYIPFNPKSKGFVSDFTTGFHPVNLSALAPTLIESELFGHVQGAFTGATKHHQGRLAACNEFGTVFLDEIGELDAGIQVKLLRLLQDRKFQRLGETRDINFRGKIVSATNRDLAAEMRAGRFRTDLYYRLCADKIATPSLREQLAHTPSDLHDLILFIARQRIKLSEEEATRLSGEVETWINGCPDLGRSYPWPGNVRELEQCVRNVMIRKQYQPVQSQATDINNDPYRALADATENGTLTAEEVLQRYYSLVYAKTGSYAGAARELKVDRRTIQRKIAELTVTEARRYWESHK
jgi:DNA-binding NtrC family response regulator